MRRADTRSGSPAGACHPSPRSGSLPPDHGFFAAPGMTGPESRAGLSLRAGHRARWFALRDAGWRSNAPGWPGRYSGGALGSAGPDAGPWGRAARRARVCSSKTAKTVSLCGRTRQCSEFTLLNPISGDEILGPLEDIGHALARWVRAYPQFEVVVAVIISSPILVMHTLIRP